MDLLQKSDAGILSNISRTIILGRIKASIRLCHEYEGSDERDFDLLVQMMNLEQSKWIDRMSPGITAPIIPPSQSDDLQLFEVSPDFLHKDKDPFSLDKMLDSPNQTDLLTESDREWGALMPADGSVSPLFLSNEFEKGFKEIYQSMIAV